MALILSPTAQAKAAAAKTSVASRTGTRSGPAPARASYDPAPPPHPLVGLAAAPGAATGPLGSTSKRSAPGLEPQLASRRSVPAHQPSSRPEGREQEGDAAGSGEGIVPGADPLQVRTAGRARGGGQGPGAGSGPRASDSGGAASVGGSTEALDAAASTAVAAATSEDALAAAVARAKASALAAFSSPQSRAAPPPQHQRSRGAGPFSAGPQRPAPLGPVSPAAPMARGVSAADAPFLAFAPTATPTSAALASGVSGRQLGAGLTAGGPMGPSLVGASAVVAGSVASSVLSGYSPSRQRAPYESLVLLPPAEDGPGGGGGAALRRVAGAPGGGSGGPDPEFLRRNALLQRKRQAWAAQQREARREVGNASSHRQQHLQALRSVGLEPLDEAGLSPAGPAPFRPTALAASLPRSLYDLERWAAVRETKLAVAREVAREAAAAREASELTFQPAIDERSRRLADVARARSPGALARPWHSPPRAAARDRSTPHTRPQRPRSASPPPYPARGAGAQGHGPSQDHHGASPGPRVAPRDEAGLSDGGGAAAATPLPPSSRGLDPAAASREYSELLDSVRRRDRPWNQPPSSRRRGDGEGGNGVSASGDGSGSSARGEGRGRPTSAAAQLVAARHSKARGRYGCMDPEEVVGAVAAAMAEAAEVLQRRPAAEARVPAAAGRPRNGRQVPDASPSPPPERDATVRLSLQQQPTPVPLPHELTPHRGGPPPSGHWGGPHATPTASALRASAPALAGALRPPQPASPYMAPQPGPPGWMPPGWLGAAAAAAAEAPLRNPTDLSGGGASSGSGTAPLPRHARPRVSWGDRVGSSGGGSAPDGADGAAAGVPGPAAAATFPGSGALPMPMSNGAAWYPPINAPPPAVAVIAADLSGGAATAGGGGGGLSTPTAAVGVFRSASLMSSPASHMTLPYDPAVPLHTAAGMTAAAPAAPSVPPPLAPAAAAAAAAPTADELLAAAAAAAAAFSLSLPASSPAAVAAAAAAAQSPPPPPPALSELSLRSYGGWARSTVSELGGASAAEATSPSAAAASVVAGTFRLGWGWIAPDSTGGGAAVSGGGGAVDLGVAAARAAEVPAWLPSLPLPPPPVSSSLSTLGATAVGAGVGTTDGVGLEGAQDSTGRAGAEAVRAATDAEIRAPEAHAAAAAGQAHVALDLSYWRERYPALAAGLALGSADGSAPASAAAPGSAADVQPSGGTDPLPTSAAAPSMQAAAAVAAAGLAATGTGSGHPFLSPRETADYSDLAPLAPAPGYPAVQPPLNTAFAVPSPAAAALAAAAEPPSVRATSAPSGVPLASSGPHPAPSAASYLHQASASMPIPFPADAAASSPAPHDAPFTPLAASSPRPHPYTPPRPPHAPSLPHDIPRGSVSAGGAAPVGSPHGGARYLPASPGPSPRYGPTASDGGGSPMGYGVHVTRLPSASRSAASSVAGTPRRTSHSRESSIGGFAAGALGVLGLGPAISGGGATASGEAGVGFHSGTLPAKLGIGGAAAPAPRTFPGVMLTSAGGSAPVVLLEAGLSPRATSASSATGGPLAAPVHSNASAGLALASPQPPHSPASGLGSGPGPGLDGLAQARGSWPGSLRLAPPDTLAVPGPGAARAAAASRANAPASPTLSVSIAAAAAGPGRVSNPGALGSVGVDVMAATAVAHAPALPAAPVSSEEPGDVGASAISLPAHKADAEDGVDSLDALRTMISRLKHASSKSLPAGVAGGTDGLTGPDGPGPISLGPGPSLGHGGTGGEAGDASGTEGGTEDGGAPGGGWQRYQAPSFSVGLWEMTGAGDLGVQGLEGSASANRPSSRDRRHLNAHETQSPAGISSPPKRPAPGERLTEGPVAPVLEEGEDGEEEEETTRRAALRDGGASFAGVGPQPGLGFGVVADAF
ncbi:hypothetical protein HYH03_014714 [Edaphochlamys debaryana]|uniref:Uncharacterized protein n=1 Tax=Edaphochlamys debaryana TaxID=47281 RepID=A0A836BTA9_9CHLO|nr:hypothetical protein HYH03_014714 [Edaphochlamys debaryana]|eukprot:KAG2486658.1 hypothetical protein HYH03_014714 [Edaphochlamys debaryana]